MNIRGRYLFLGALRNTTHVNDKFRYITSILFVLDKDYYRFLTVIFNAFQLLSRRPFPARLRRKGKSFHHDTGIFIICEKSVCRTCKLVCPCPPSFPTLIYNTGTAFLVCYFCLIMTSTKFCVLVLSLNLFTIAADSSSDCHRCRIPW